MITLIINIAILFMNIVAASKNIVILFSYWAVQFKNIIVINTNIIEIE